jgi:hypothetical protein
MFMNELTKISDANEINSDANEKNIHDFIATEVVFPRGWGG